MKTLIIFFLIILIILFFPIHKMIKAIINEDGGSLTLYKKTFDLSHSNIDDLASKVFEKKPKKKAKEKRHKVKMNFLNLIDSLRRLKFKPTLKMDLDLKYGFDDAMVTGISYGAIVSIVYFLKWIIDIPFKSKKYDFQITPVFNKNVMILFLNCIIWLNIAKIFYMVIIIISNIKITKQNLRRD